ncbi:MAG: glycosyltransferase family 4 protein [Chloroflexi bacterium]|nr:glycosyltransferase family 4 protein [Chloroflexota bacterium]
MRLLVITPKVDPNDDLFGHVHTWMTALAERVERLYVVALWAGDPALPPNARFFSLGKEETGDKLLWLARLQRVVGRLCLSGEVDAVLAHMAPIFAVAAAPLARLARRPLFLWYAHGQVSPMLRLAHALVAGAGTSTTAGFRIRSGKLTITGQGIDTERFRPVSGAPAGPPTILSVGRFSPIKGFETVLDGFAELGRESAEGAAPRLVLVGGVHGPGERRYLPSLRGRAERLGLGDRVGVETGIPHAQMPSVYQRATMLVSCSRTGSLDKVVLEAAACGVLPIVADPAFRPFLGESWDQLSFPPGDARALAACLTGWLDRSESERRALAARLRAVVEGRHSVSRLADAVVHMIAEQTGCR